MKKWYAAILWFILFQCISELSAQNFEILNDICADKYYFVAIKEYNNVDTIMKYSFEYRYVEKRISEGVIELIMESPFTFDYLRIVKDDGVWKRDEQKSGQIIGNPKYMSMRPPNFSAIQANRETFIITTDGTIEFEMLNKSKTIVQIKQIEDKNLEWLRTVRN